MKTVGIGGRAAVGLGLVLCFAVSAFSADTTFVKPGDDGTIEYPIENILPTDGAAEGVKISAHVEPPEFASAVTIVEAGSTLGPLDIANQQTQTFVVKYTVGQNAPEGAFNIVLHADMISAGPSPDITDPSQDIEVGFNIGSLIHGEAHQAAGKVGDCTCEISISSATGVTSGNCPGTVVCSTLSAVTPGPITLELMWSGGQDPTDDLLVQMSSDTSAQSAIKFETQNWSKTKFDDDTWTGTAVVPATGYEGPLTVLVNSSQTFITLNMKDVRKFPSITLSDGWTEFLSGFQGANATPVATTGGLPSSFGPLQYTLESKSGQGLASLSIVPQEQQPPPQILAWDSDDPYIPVQVAPANLGGATKVKGSLSFTAPGTYIFRAVDNANLTTLAKFTVAGLGVKVSTRSASNYLDRNRFDGSISLELTATAGLEHFYRYDTSQSDWWNKRSAEQSLDLSGTSSAQSYTFNSVGRQDPDFFGTGMQGLIRDAGGQSSSFSVGLSTSVGGGDFRWINRPDPYDQSSGLNVRTSSKSLRGDLHWLPGAVAMAGQIAHISFFPGGEPIQCKSQFDPERPAPGCTLGKVKFLALDGGSPRPLFEGVVTCSGTVQAGATSGTVPLFNDVAFRGLFVPEPGMCDLWHCLEWDNDDPDHPKCTTGYTWVPALDEPYPDLRGVSYGVGAMADSAAQFSPGDGQSVSLGAGVKAAFDAIKAGFLRLSVSAPAAEIGWANIPNGFTFSLAASCSDCFSGPLRLTVPLSKALTAKQLALLKATKFESNGQQMSITPISAAANSISFSLNSFSSFRIQAPIYEQPVVVSMGGASLMSGNPQALLGWARNRGLAAWRRMRQASAAKPAQTAGLRQAPAAGQMRFCRAFGAGFDPGNLRLPGPNGRTAGRLLSGPDFSTSLPELDKLGPIWDFRT